MCIEEDVGVKDLEANMKRLLIRLTGLIVTLSIVLSTGGMAMATETGEQDNGTGVASTQPAEIPDTQEPSKEEDPAPEEPAPAEDPADAPAVDPAAQSDDPAGAPVDLETPTSPEAPAEEPTEEKAPSEEPAKEESKEGTRELSGSVKFEYSSDELSQGYINKVFGASAKKRSSFNYGSLIANENTLALYEYSRQQITDIANGTITSTIITMPEDVYYTYKYSDLGYETENNEAYRAAETRLKAELKTVVNTLLQSNPYEFYWFDKTEGYEYSISYKTTSDSYIMRISNVGFYVSKDYQGADEHHVSSVYGEAAQTARDNALAIINKFKDLDDYKKLSAYKNKILELTDYNYAAIQSDYDKQYKNPWQLVWVFDGNPDTKVVCEGYSKAFQFLCDNSTFRSSDVYVLSVVGLNNGSRHMWNVVHMEDGNYYLADITNCDTGYNVFLRGRSHVITDGYKLIVGEDQSGNPNYFTYVYDGTTATPDIAPADYIYSQTPAGDQPVFYSHGMILAGEIGLRFGVDFPEGFDATNCYMLFNTLDGKTTRVDYADAVQGNGNLRYFTIYMSILEFADMVDVTLYYGDNQTKSDSYSGIYYVNDIRNTSYSNDDNLMFLINSLHAYAYYMQLAGWSDGRLHASIPESGLTFSEDNIEQVKQYVNFAQFGMTSNLGTSGLSDDIKVGLTLTSATELRVSVKPESDAQISGDYITRTINEQTYYQFSRKNIGPKSLGTPMTFEITTDKGTANISVPAIYYIRLALDSDTFTYDQKISMVAYFFYYYSAIEVQNSYGG